jgi:hypothetical protein
VATPVFNDAETNSLKELKFENGAMDALLSTKGNTVRVRVAAPGEDSVSFHPPGADWTAERTMGLGPRRVIWEAQLAAGSDADLNSVEQRIETYLRDGRVYILTDGKGRSSDHAKLVGDGTERVGMRESTPDGRRLQRWRLTFLVLWPRTNSATKL